MSSIPWNPRSQEPSERPTLADLAARVASLERGKRWVLLSAFLGALSGDLVRGVAVAFGVDPGALATLVGALAP